MQSTIVLTMAYATTEAHAAHRFATGHRIYNGEYPTDLCTPYKASGTTPEAIDWTDHMNPIRDQGKCGSCHTFATVAVLEAASAIAGKPVELSEEQLIDCMNPHYKIGETRPNPDPHQDWSTAGGCQGGTASENLIHYTKGGWEAVKLDGKPGGGPGACACSRKSVPYAKDEADWPGSITDDPKTWPYTMPQQACGESSCDCALEKGVVQECQWVQGDPSVAKEQLKNAVAKQPVAVAINADVLAADPWAQEGGAGYGKDILYPEESTLCKPGQGTDHAVVVVGFGKDSNGVEYFKIRNSWGSKWANEGYFKLKADVGGSGPLCMFSDKNNLGVFPVLSTTPTPAPMPTPPAPMPTPPAPMPTPPAPMPTPTPAPAPTPAPTPPSPSKWCHGKIPSVNFKCAAGTRCCGSHTLTPSCIYYSYNTCCEHNGVAVVCAKGQKCGVLAGVPTCQALEGANSTELAV